jgi:hypothetical protein
MNIIDSMCFHIYDEFKQTRRVTMTISTAVKINQVIQKLTDATDLLDIIGKDGAVSNKEILAIVNAIQKCKGDLRKINDTVIFCPE